MTEKTNRRLASLSERIVQLDERGLAFIEFAVLATEALKRPANLSLTMSEMGAITAHQDLNQNSSGAQR